MLMPALARSSTPRGCTLCHPRRRNQSPTRGGLIVHLGELSAAGRALTAEPLAPASDATLAELRDPMRRPPEPYSPLPSEVTNYQPEEPCPFPLPAFLAGLRKARRGAAASPSGATNEHLRILLDDVVGSQLLHCAAQRLAQADVPAPALAAIRVGTLGPCSCSCCWALDASRDHRAASSTSDVLASRALPLERAIARVEARVGRNVALAAMIIDLLVHDARVIEAVVCNGLPLWHGAQFAVDATLVSPVTRDGRSHNDGRRTPRSTEADAVASSFSSRWADTGLRKLSPLFASLPRVQQVPLPPSATLPRPSGFSDGVASSPSCARCHFL